MTSQANVHLLVTVIFVTLIAITHTGRCPAAPKNTLSLPMPVELGYDGASISGHFDNIPVQKVLDALAKHVGLRVSLANTTIGDWPISGILQADRVRTAIEKILTGFSYVLCSDTNGFELIILSTQPKRPRREIAAATKAQEIFNSGDTDGGSQAAIGRASLALNQQSDGSAASPQTINEFLPITIAEPILQVEAEESGESDAAAREAQEQKYNDAILQRALDALRSEHQHLHTEAIDQLADLTDPRATEALLEAVSNIQSHDTNFRFQVAAALVRHAEQLKYNHASSASFIKQLASAQDANVRSIAREALKQMEQSRSSESPLE